MIFLKRSIFFVAALLLTAVQGVRAQTWIVVDNESALHSAVQTNGASVRVTADITLTHTVSISHKTRITIDLNGHTLNRDLSASAGADGHIVALTNNSTVTINATGGGTLSGGFAGTGGVIYVGGGEDGGSHLVLNNVTITGGQAGTLGGAIYNDGTTTINGGTISNCRAGTSGGAIYNDGSLSVTGLTITGCQAAKAGAIANYGTLVLKDCTVDKNTADDVGGVYNATGGFATITGSTFTGNTGPKGCGAIGNASDAKQMTVSNTVITGNTAGTNGGGLWNASKLTVTGGTIQDNVCADDKNGAGIFHTMGTLTLTGNPVIKENHKAGGKASNVYLAEKMVLSVTEAFSAGASIGLSAHKNNFYYTKGFETNCRNTDPEDIFFSDEADYGFTVFNHEVVRYEKVSSMDTRYLAENGTMITKKGCFKVSELKDLSGVSMTNGWYVVDKNTTIENRIEIVGIVNLILADNTRLDAQKGIHVPYSSTLNIWAQRSGADDEVGALLANAAGQGSNRMGRQQFVAGIGENRTGTTSGERQGEINIHGGDVIACGGDTAPGIGGYNGKDITITGGSVFAVGGEYAAGIGCGMQGVTPKYITITGGTVRALGSYGGAGIGSGYGSYNHVPAGGSSFIPKDGLHNVRITGGHVIAMGAGAGIGGGIGTTEYEGCEGNVYIEGGIVEAQTILPASDSRSFLLSAQAIGHGGSDKVSASFNAFALKGELTVYPNAKVTAVQYYGGNEVVVPAAVRTQALRWSMVTVAPCDHSDLPLGEVCPNCGGRGLSLFDASNNKSAIMAAHNMAADVKLEGRTFYKDGSWNTICLPFALSGFLGTPLEGATVKTLNGAELKDGVLTIIFGETVTDIKAGVPYIVKWDSGENITNPVFGGVTIRYSTGTRSYNGVTFKGTYEPEPANKPDGSVLYLGADNQLYRAKSNLNINSFRGYLELDRGLQPSRVILKIEGETTE